MIVELMLEAHLRVSQVKNQVLSLVANVVLLETEEQSEPVHEVAAGVVCRVGIGRECSDGPQGIDGGAYL